MKALSVNATGFSHLLQPPDGARHTSPDTASTKREKRPVGGWGRAAQVWELRRSGSVVGTLLGDANGWVSHALAHDRPHPLPVVVLQCDDLVGERVVAELREPAPLEVQEAQRKLSALAFVIERRSEPVDLVEEQEGVPAHARHGRILEQVDECGRLGVDARELLRRQPLRPRVSHACTIALGCDSNLGSPAGSEPQFGSARLTLTRRTA